MQPSNILYIIDTFEVSKFDKFNEVKDEQSRNMDCIHLTCEVSKFDKFNETNDEQPRNIACILVTFEVLKLEKSISVISDHP